MFKREEKPQNEVRKNGVGGLSVCDSRRVNKQTTGQNFSKKQRSTEKKIRGTLWDEHRTSRYSLKGHFCCSEPTFRQDSFTILPK